MANGETFGTDSSVGSTIALLEARLPGVRERRRRLEDELATVVAQENAMVSVLQGLTALSGAALDGASAGGQGAAPATPAPEAADVSADGAAGGPAEEERASRPEPEPAAAGPARRRTAKSTAGNTEAARRNPAEKTTAKKTTARRSAAAKSVAATGTTGAAAGGTAPVRGGGKAPAKRAAVGKKAPSADRPVPVEEPPVAEVPTASGRRRRLTNATSVLAVLAGASGPLRAREVTGLLGLDDQESSVNAVRTMLERLAKTGKARRSGRGLYVAAAS